MGRKKQFGDRLFVLVSPDLKTKAAQKAKQQGTTTSDVARGLLEAWVRGEVDAKSH